MHDPVKREILLYGVLSKAGATPISELPHLKHGQPVKIAGLIAARQHPPTAKGFAFLTVEDLTCKVNVVVHPMIYVRDPQALHGALVLVEGASSMITNLLGETLTGFLPDFDLTQTFSGIH